MTATWLAPTDGAVLATVERDGHPESFHPGILSVVDGDGNVLFEAGRADRVVYPRSTIKPLQTLAVMRTGVELTDLEIALATASHSGSLAHRNAITTFLQRHVLSEGLLQCPADWPLSVSEKASLIAEGGDKSPLAMNCSGKHTGFLAACQHRGDPLESYLEVDHPLQRDIKNTIEEFTGEEIAHTSIDGCGSPLHAITLRGLSKGIARLLSSEDPDAKRIVSAIGAHPWALSGENTANTTVIETLGGIAKIGAEGLVVVGLPGGVTASVKILDGSMRATTPVVLEALARVGAVSAEVVQNLRGWLDEPVRGGSTVIGGLLVTLGDGAPQEDLTERRKQ
jgi:L-asparaginase II